MGYCTWWLTIALSFSALAASQGNETTELPMEPFDAKRAEPPAVTVFDNSATLPPVVIPFDIEEAEDDDDEDDVTEDDEVEIDLPSRDFMDTNPKEVKGQPVFEGDMLLTQGQWRAIRERKGLASASYRWNEGSDGNPLVPYIFIDGRLNTAVIKEAMDHWTTHTCIKFEETTNIDQKHLRYIYGGGCYSYMGMQSSNGQDVSIGEGCDTLGIVAHEIGHAMGFAHEQSRPDRDDYVVINYENIRDDREGNFAKYSTSFVDTQNIMYDYSSDMHYGSTGFTINGKSTIATIDPLAQELIGQRTGLSHRDKRLANIMYNCIDKWLTKCRIESDPCQNGGYYGKGCACVCPPGTSGSNCEKQTGNYYASLLNTCTEKITTAGTLTSPNYPNNYPATRCVKWIEAPECHVPKLTFSDFEMYRKNPYCNGNTCCYFDALEIRTSNRNSGDVFCDTDISAGQSFTGTSREMILFFRTKSRNHKGWSAELTFEKQDGCEGPKTTSAPATESTTSTTLESSTQGSEPKCKIESYNGVYYWSSPDFGEEDYPNNFRCGLSGSANTGTYGLSLKLNTFQLQRKKNRKCLDAVKLTLANGRTRTLCANKSGRTFSAPSFNFVLEFTTDDAITAKGFNISLTPTLADCTKVLTPSAGETGMISASRSQRLCEYRIVAPSGSQVRIDEISPKILKSMNCARDWLALNGNSEKMYPTESSKVLCGWSKDTSLMTSTSGEMYVAYKGSRKSRGFSLKYTIV